MKNFIYVLILILYNIFSIFAIDLSSCGKTKECVMHPVGCNITSPACLIFTYAWNSSQEKFFMELNGGNGLNKQYSAVAFSPTGKMKNSDLYYCTGKQLKSGVIEMQYSTPKTQSHLPVNVSVEKAQTVNGIAFCSFYRPANVAKTINGNLVNFDLSSKNYYLLQAVGNINNETLEKHKGENVGRFSSGPYNFTHNSIYVQSTTSPEHTPTPTSDTNVNAGCNKIKGCFTNPPSCRGGTSSCMFFSWTYDSGLNAFNFEIIGGTANQYAAVAFGIKNQMEDADLYYCTKSKLYSGAIILNEETPTVYNSLPSGVKSLSVQVIDGVLKCSFYRPAAVSKPITNGINYNFNLAKESFYLLYAFGAAQQNGGLTFHYDTKAISQSRINFTDITEINPSANVNFDLVKVHASLMLIAWVSCASIGVLVSRHCKPLWRDFTIFGHKVWFQVHRSLMIITFVFTIIGFILIFVAKKSYSYNAGAHPILGIIVTFSVIINPVMAVFRPPPASTNRPLFNWFHRKVGTCARILSIAAIFLGLNLPFINLSSSQTWIMLGFVCLHVAFEVALELVSFRYGHISEYHLNKQDNDEIDRQYILNLPLPGKNLKKIIMAIYTLSNLGMLIALVVPIVQN